MSQIRHATDELLDAMRGELDTTRPPHNACDGRYGIRVFASLGTDDTHLREDTDSVNCPQCLRLMAKARGSRRQAEFEVWQDMRLESEAARQQSERWRDSPPEGG